MLHNLDRRADRARAAAANGASCAPLDQSAANVSRLTRRERVRYNFRRPDKSDGAAVWELVRQSDTLDLNSAYSYLMLGEYFADTCRVAYRNDRLAGFVAGFTPPRRPDTLFVWQVAVDRRERGQGLAKQLLRDLLGTPACGHLRYLEATVTPSNMASERLFRRVARELGTSCRVEAVFDEDDFPGDDHEAERRFRIGPIAIVGRASPAA